MNATFLVNEVHKCLQGEGPNIGVPALLVRFQICNLRCSWCDTVDTHTYSSGPYTRMTLQDLTQTIRSSQMHHFILTGGEPTLQNIGLLVRTLKECSEQYTFEVESNGTRIPHKQIKGFFESDYALMQWNISPKFENANEKIVAESLSHWAILSHTHEKVFFKFVIRKKYKVQDLKNILSLIEKFHIPAHRVILMAEGTTQKSQTSNVWLHDICLSHGFRLTPRLHILIFGSKRGV